MEPLEPFPCRCCGIPCVGTDTMRGKAPACIGCAGYWAASVTCGRVHGAELEREALELVAAGAWSPWYAVAVMARDDAQLTDRLLIVVNGKSTPPARCLIVDPPQRWEVLAARAAIRGERISVEELVEAVLGVCWGWPRTEANMLWARQQLAQAVAVGMDCQVTDVEILVFPDPNDRDAFIADIRVRTPPANPDDVVAVRPPEPSGDAGADELARALPARGRAQA